MGDQEEDYTAKAKNIFTLLNKFRQNPKSLAKQLEILRSYLDRETNVLSEPNKIQIQMVEGDSIFREAISYLKSLQPLEPLEWDELLAASAKEHVNDIGPKGLLLYQSSDGTEPEDRIAKYGNYSETLGENIDFGPNDEMGVIISLTLDDGEEQRPHRENLFKSDYQKVGIACGPHKTEFKMCVMDFAYDFFPLKNNNYKDVASYKNSPIVNLMVKDNKMNNAYDNQYNIQMNKIDILNNSNYANNKSNYDENNNVNNQSPLVKLSLEQNDVLKRKNDNLNYNFNSKTSNMINENVNIIANNTGYKEIEDLVLQTRSLMKELVVKEKKVEIVTKIKYILEDGSTKEVEQNEKHTFKY